MLIKRRNILGGGAALGVTSLYCNAMAAPEASANDLILVSILLNGGNDGLNTVVPLPQYGHYYDLRTPATPPTGLAVAYDEADLELLAFNSNYKVPALSATEFAFAPSMLAMRDLYTTGKLAVINGVGLPLTEQNALSHYNAVVDWLTGKINIGATLPAGWLGVTLDKVKGGSLGATASLGGTTQLLIGNAKQGLVINPPMDYFGISYGISDNQADMVDAFKRIAVLPAASTPGTFDQGILQTAVDDIASVKHYANINKATDYPLESWLDYQLRDIARLIVGHADIRGYFAQIGGFDTHSQQALQQPTLLSQLGQSLVNFYEFLASRGATENVVVMTMTDFGRRPNVNLNFGTDHGGANVAFVFGDRVHGGTYGAYPSLTHFDVNGNLKLNYDFRNVLSDLIYAMGGSGKDVLGESYHKIGFI
jgi:uncharacterized protein (DUF1501 family)